MQGAKNPKIRRRVVSLMIAFLDGFVCRMRAVGLKAKDSCNAA